jgi:hypothetical protein
LPKEITHWHLGVEALKGSAPLYSRMKENSLFESAFLLGAVSHDSPYFSDPFIPGAEDIAELLHGKHGEDTFMIVRNLFRTGMRFEGEARYVHYYFALGLLSHIILDSVVHPLVYYVTGDYYAKSKKERARARTAHRNFESILELYIVRNTGTIYANHTLVSLLRNISSYSSVLAKSIETILEKNKKKKRKIRSNYLDHWKYHAILYGIFSSAVWGRLIRRCPLLPNGIRALGKSILEEQYYYIETPLEYKDEYVSILTLCETARKSLKSYFLEFENIVLGISDEIPLTNEWGPSLNSGIPRQGLVTHEYRIIPELLRLV